MKPPPRTRKTTTARQTPQAPAADVPADEPQAERLQKVLARAGVASRRAVEDLIRGRRVVVNGRVAELGDRVDPNHDRVEVDGARIPLDPHLRYYVFNKPRGVLTTARDPGGRADLSGYFPKGERVFSVGRLDRDTEGLLVLTNDGELAHRLTHPRYGVEKEYLAEVDGAPTRGAVARLARGVELDDGVAKAKSANIVGGARGRAAIRIVMTEGRKREVRRMLGAVGLPVTRLVRTRVGPIRVGRLSAGEVRELSREEIQDLWKAAGAPR